MVSLIEYSDNTTQIGIEPSSDKETVRGHCHSKYKAILKSYQDQPGHEPIIAEFGEFSKEFMFSILYRTEQKLIISKERRSLISKVYHILIEGLQNIRYHGARDAQKRQIGFIIIGRNKNNYVINTANLVDKGNARSLAERLGQIEGLGYNSLNKLYLNTLANGYVSRYGTAGMGLMTMALKSANHLSYNLEKINNDLMYFNLELKIDIL